MSIPEEATLSRELTDWRARTISILLVVGGLIISGASSLIATPWIEAVALALSTTLISLGALSLVFDLALRRSVYREVLKLVGIQKSVVAGQLAAIGRARTVDWELILEDRSSYRVLLLDPSAWVDGNFQFILDSARRRLVAVELFLPDPHSPYLAELADSLSVELAAFRASVIQAADRVERMWTAERQEGGLLQGSKITIRLLPKRPVHSLVLADNSTVLLQTGVVGREGADADFSYVYSGDRDVYPSSWFLRQLERLTGSPIKFENEV